MAEDKDDDVPLKRLGGGRWQSRDGRFTIEPQSGTWVVVDGEQTDELGLPRVRGPFGSLRAARAAVADAREGPPESSALAARMATRERSAPAAKGRRAERPSSSRASRPPAEPTPTEPAWLGRLTDAEREEARRLIRDLEAAGLPDPIGLARRDVVDDEPAVARALVVRRIATMVLERRAGGEPPASDTARDLATDLVIWLTTRSRDPEAPLRLPGWRFVEDTERARRIEVTRAQLGDEIARLERRSEGDAGTSTR